MKEIEMLFPENFVGTPLDHVIGGVVGSVLGGLLAVLIAKIIKEVARRRKGIAS
jgi:hypothetical protein